MSLKVIQDMNADPEYTWIGHSQGPDGWKATLYRYNPQKRVVIVHQHGLEHVVTWLPEGIVSLIKEHF
jgi:hypothetical protein